MAVFSHRWLVEIAGPANALLSDRATAQRANLGGFDMALPFTFSTLAYWTLYQCQNLVDPMG